MQEKLLPLVCGELPRLARFYRNQERSNFSWQGEDLVRETCLGFARQDTPDLKNKGQFFALAASSCNEFWWTIMRIFRMNKRCMSKIKVPLYEAKHLALKSTDVDILAIKPALNELAKLDAPRAQIVDLRFFAGFSIEETAELLALFRIRSKGEWVTAHAWL